MDRVVVKYVDRTVFKTRTRVITTTKPDGTKIVDEENTKVQAQTSDKKVEEEKKDVRIEAKESVTVSSLSRYYVGGYVSSGLSILRPVYTVSVGARIGNLPLFIGVTGQPLEKQIGLGLQLEF